RGGPIRLFEYRLGSDLRLRGLGRTSRFPDAARRRDPRGLRPLCLPARSPAQTSEQLKQKVSRGRLVKGLKSIWDARIYLRGNASTRRLGVVTIARFSITVSL